jgi:hypothetical protein
MAPQPRRKSPLTKAGDPSISFYTGLCWIYYFFADPLTDPELAVTAVAFCPVENPRPRVHKGLQDYSQKKEILNQLTTK